MDQRHQDNRQAWNEAAARYEEEVEADIAFLRAGGKNLMAPELPFLADLSSWCRRAIHLQCAGGRDTLSLWNHGAAEVIGVDISDRMIACARRKSEALGAPAQWYCCDILDTPHELDGTADLIYTGRGALCWNMDIDAWAKVVARLLRPGGRLYVFEGHPLDWLWDMTTTELKFDPQPPYGNYFSQDIGVNQGWPETYIPATSLPDQTQQARKHERQWTLGQILNALVGAGLQLARFEEHPDQYWEQFPNLPEDVVKRLPHTFSLLMHKEPLPGRRASSPYLHFDFGARENRAPLVFTHPAKVFVASHLEEVRPCLQAIQEGVQNGYYAAGYISYEAAPAFDSAFQVKAGHTLPLLWFGLFERPAEIPDAFALSFEAAFAPDNWKFSLSKAEYEQKMGHLKQAIGQGETYQVNFTLRAETNFAGEDAALYQQLRAAQQANYSAYLNLGRFRLLSASPELFFERRGNTLTARPMKGTCPRGRWQEEDEEFAQNLHNSEKERAENIMIVDLLRNDLGRIARIGSVRVPELFTVERYPTVWQMTSTITAELEPNTSLEDLFAALFPCGSVTGAPKIAAMQFIADLEAMPREAYCGAIGYMTPNNDAVFNVAIRTVIVDAERETATYGVGSGVTWDSTPNGEYAEILTKAAILTEATPNFDLLETLRLENGVYFLRERHLARLAASARYFERPCSLEVVETALSACAAEHSAGVWRVRLLLSQMGEPRLECFPLTPLPLGAAQTVVWAEHSVLRANRFLYHKTTHREVYERALQSFPDVFDVLLTNEDGEPTEFTRGNLVIETAGGWQTPPRDCGLLAGTLREEMLANGRLQERQLTRADVENATQVFFINSVRGMVPVTFRR